MRIQNSFGVNRFKSGVTQASKYRIKYMLYLMLLTFGLHLSAHEEPMEKGWCANGDIQIIGTFNLTAALLERFRVQQSPVCSQYRSCGQFDDDYNLAIRAGNAMCHSFDTEEREYRNDGHFGTIRIVIHGPTTLKNGESNHHLLYSTQQGAHFSCALCVKKALEPIRNLEVTR